MRETVAEAGWRRQGERCRRRVEGAQRADVSLCGEAAHQQQAVTEQWRAVEGAAIIMPPLLALHPHGLPVQVQGEDLPLIEDSTRASRRKSGAS